MVILAFFACSPETGTRIPDVVGTVIEMRQDSMSDNAVRRNILGIGCHMAVKLLLVLGANLGSVRDVLEDVTGWASWLTRVTNRAY